MDLSIEVTDLDIERGEREDCKRCPVARAVTRAANAQGYDIQHIDVSCQMIDFWTKDEHWQASTTPEIDQFIDRFDAWGSGEPFVSTVSFNRMHDDCEIPF